MIRNYSKLKQDEIEIWINHYNDIDELSGQITLLSSAEIQRANSFHYREDRNRYIQAHALLRLILCKYTGARPQAIDYEIGFYGKPYLKTDIPVYFNLSHTKEIIAVAVAPKYNIGIDIEKKTNLADIDSVAHQFMSQEEYNGMVHIKPNLKQDYFYHCWTQKEAVIKASGRGIDNQLHSFSVMDGFQVERAKTIFTCSEGTQRVWWLEAFNLDLDHIGAVSIESTSDHLNYSIIFRSYNLLNQFEVSSHGTC